MPLNTSKFPIFELPPLHMADEEKTKKAKKEWQKKFELDDTETMENMTYGS